MAAYYNEVDRFAAAWLRELIKAGLIADGEVDERSIELVRPDDLRGFRQCHFFAGIGGWSYALRLAGWPDDRDVWTGSCPCQPWSMAGRGEGADDPRHLWPAWSRLIEVGRPLVVFGEQVASEDGRYWLDLVFAAMESRDYAIGAADLPACGVGAPNQRQRLWFVADTDSERCEGERLHVRERRSLTAGVEAARRGEVGAVRTPVGDERCGCWDRNAFHRTVGMFPGERCVNHPRPLGDTDRGGAERIAGHKGRAEPAASLGRQDEGRGRLQTLDPGALGELGHAHGSRLEERPDAEVRGRPIRLQGAAVSATGATRGFWAECDWLYHRDGQYRSVEPGTFPLASRVSGDMDKIRAFGNAINPYVAAAFIEAYCEARGLA